MTYPNSPGYPPPGQPPAPYPPAAPQQGYYQAPQQGYYQAPPPPQAQAPAPPRRTATLADYLDQKAGGTKPLQWLHPGTRYLGMVKWTLTDADTEEGDARDDGSVKLVLKIPLKMNPTAEYPDGEATFYCKGHDWTELKRAMSDAGAPPGPPEAGAWIDITYTHDQPVPGGRSPRNPRKVKAMIYTPPRGATPAPDGNGQQAAPQDTPPWTPPAPQIPPEIQGMVPQGPATPANFANPGGHYGVPQQGQPQWPAPGAPLSAPPQPAPPGENPYNNPVPQQQQAPQGPPAPQMPAQPGPAAQVASAAQAGVQAAQQAQAPQPAYTPYVAALMKQVQGQPLTEQEQRDLAAGPPQ